MLYYSTRYIIVISWKLKQFIISTMYNKVVTTRQVSINDVTINDYKIHINDKLYDISIVTNGKQNYKYKCMTKLKKDVKENILRRNIILHCSFLESESEKTIDLTESFRQFFLHFDEKREECKMENFFLYIVYTKQLPKHIIDNMSFYIILNDSSFSERYYNVKDIYSHHFYDIVKDVNN